MSPIAWLFWNLSWFINDFNHCASSIEKVSKIPSPVLIIHGTEDEVIDFSHGLALFERCPKAVEPLWVEGAGHNDIELYSQYLERLRRFINQDLAAQHAWETNKSLCVCINETVCVNVCEKDVRMCTNYRWEVNLKGMCTFCHICVSLKQHTFYVTF